ncbi:MAG TPA: hypothetical protein VGH73_21010 [Thermoanaerobaculia bacterium]|jgi:hypothetical protein
MRFTKPAILIVSLALALAWAALAQPQPPQKPGAPAKPGGRPASGPGRSAAAPQSPDKPQAPPGSSGSSGKPGQGGAAGTEPGANPPDTGNIDEILQGEEDVLSGSGFSYDPGNRRDPFKSLLAAADRPEIRGPRPEGVPGLLIEEIDLTGIFRTSKGFVAQVVAANQKKSYLLKSGDQLYDGDVVSINKNEVVFKQIVQDPTALKPFREVVKSLSPAR